MARAVLAIVAALALSGCDKIGEMLGIDASDTNRSASNGSGGSGGDGLIANLQPVDGAAPPGQDEGQPNGMQEAGPGEEMPPGPQDGMPGGIDPSQLIGRWGDNGNCAQAVQFFANYTFIAPNGGRGNWRLNGDRLTLFSGERSATFRLRSIDSQRLVVEDSNGQTSESIRC